MAYIFKPNKVEYELKQAPIPEFAWHTSANLADIGNSSHLDFSIRQLDPDKYSYPYHFHRNDEEMFVIMCGKAMLRTPEKHIELIQGDVIFFEKGSAGAHQLYNHTQKECIYLDIRTKSEIDICEYPDSGKINVIPFGEIYEINTRVDYFKGENAVKRKWQKDIDKTKQL